MVSSVAWIMQIILFFYPRLGLSYLNCPVHHRGRQQRLTVKQNNSSRIHINVNSVGTMFPYKIKVELLMRFIFINLLDYYLTSDARNFVLGRSHHHFCSTLPDCWGWLISLSSEVRWRRWRGSPCCRWEIPRCRHKIHDSRQQILVPVSVSAFL